MGVIAHFQWIGGKITLHLHSDGQQNTSFVCANILMAVRENRAASLLHIVSAYGESRTFVSYIRTARSVFPHLELASSRQPR